MKIFFVMQKNLLDYYKEFLKKNKIKSDPNKKKWLETCIGWKNKYDPVKKEFFEKHNYVHPYAFIRTYLKKWVMKILLWLIVVGT